MTAPRDMRYPPNGRDAERLGSEGPGSAVTRASAAIAQPVPQNPEHHSDYGTRITRTCSDCGKGITRGSRSGKCFECYHGSGQRDSDKAAIGSARLLSAINAYHAREQGRAAL